MVFDLSGSKIILPDTIVWGIPYNSQTRGYNPIGGANGPYNSLNVDVEDFPEVGCKEDASSFFIFSPY